MQLDKSTRQITLQKSDQVVFAGDSITNAFCKLEEPIDAYQLGSGYALMTASHLMRTGTGDGLRFFNRGISGNTISDLHARWSQDVLSLKPTVISILIGINDVAQEAGGSPAKSPAEFEREYRAILQETRTALPNVRLVLCETFALLCGRVDERWMGPLANRQRIVATLSQEFGTTFLPLQREFDTATQEASSTYWSYDGIHPTAAGHGIISHAWLSAIRREPVVRKAAAQQHAPQPFSPTA